MAGQGSGSRKSHTKSRKGCKTCKRRHIRCDETIPQCKNCTKHNVRCDYMDGPLPADDASNISSSPSLSSMDDHFFDNLLEDHEWLTLNSMPFNSALNSTTHSPHDTYLLHHISSLSAHMRLSDPRHFSVWTKEVPFLKFLRIASSNRFVMQAILSLSRYYASWTADETQTIQNLYHHQHALQGLQDAISKFSVGNADACLAASILLSWQGIDSQSWTSLMQGCSSIVVQMQQMKTQGLHGEFEEELNGLEFANSLKVRLSMAEESNVINNCFAQLQQLAPLTQGNEDETRACDKMSAVLQHIASQLPMMSSEQEFSLIHPLRAWLFFLPLQFLSRMKKEPRCTILIANFYGILLALEQLFPSVGSSYFAPMTIAPIRQAYTSIVYHMQGVRGTPAELEWGVLQDMMAFPVDQISQYYTRRCYQPLNIDTQAFNSSQEDFMLQIDLENIMAITPFPELVGQEQQQQQRRQQQQQQQSELLRPPARHSRTGSNGSIDGTMFGGSQYSPLLSPYVNSPQQLSPLASPHVSPNLSPYHVTHSPHSTNSPCPTYQQGGSPVYYMSGSPNTTQDDIIGLDSQVNWADFSDLNLQYHAKLEELRKNSEIWA